MSILDKLFGKVKAPLQDTSKNSLSVQRATQASPDQAAGLVYGGLNNDPITEPIPQYTTAQCEKIISNNTNAWIVLGRDRPNNLASGYGGMGSTGAGSIDLVVGRRPLDPKIYVDPNFRSDAARIHISQRTDVDKNFNLVAGSVGAAEARSAIGMKADEVRIVARSGIKLVTEGRGATNSQGGDIKTTHGIDLIAGNYDGRADGRKQLQPIPRGLEVVDCLTEMMGLIDELAAMVATNSNSLVKTNINLAQHFHISPFMGAPTTPSPTAAVLATSQNTQLFAKCVGPMYTHRINTQTFRVNYLNPAGSNWICSRYNNTN
tara:strand:+ start:1488 stop:2444 length:957 start_codon:yes stop_codon:yes gene_type:complete